MPLHGVSAIPWQPDCDANVCTECATPFTLFKRRHHCRACGQIFCGPCSVWRQKVPRLGMRTPVRLCGTCAHNEAPPPPKSRESSLRPDAYATFSRASSSSSSSSSPSSSCSSSTSTASGGSCAQCHRTGLVMRKCAGCKAVSYCSKSCSLEHWGIHEAVCLVARRRGSASASASASSSDEE